MYNSNIRQHSFWVVNQTIFGFETFEFGCPLVFGSYFEGYSHTVQQEEEAICARALCFHTLRFAHNTIIVIIVVVQIQRIKNKQTNRRRRRRRRQSGQQQSIRRRTKTTFTCAHTPTHTHKYKHMNTRALVWIQFGKEVFYKRAIGISM